MTATRGTSNANERGSNADRKARKWWLLKEFESYWFGPGWTHCYRCRALLCYDTLTVDRVLPGCKGGTYRRTNIRPACGGCNSRTGGALARRMFPVKKGGRTLKIDEQVRLMEPRRYTRKQAAVIVGRDLDTLKRWKREGVFVPHEQRKFGSLVVDLYSEEDISQMKRIAKSIRTGRKKSA